MPRLNLKDEETGAEGGAPETSRTPMPTGLREVGGGGGKLSPIVLVILIVAILGAAVFALNYFKVIHLWGKKAPVVTETFPEPELAPVPEAAAPAETVPVPEPVPVAKGTRKTHAGRHTDRRRTLYHSVLCVAEQSQSR